MLGEYVIPFQIRNPASNLGRDNSTTKGSNVSRGDSAKITGRELRAVQLQHIFGYALAFLPSPSPPILFFGALSRMPPSAYLTDHPPVGRAEGIPLLNRNIPARRNQARFPIRISQHRGFSRPFLPFLRWPYSIHEAIFHPFSRFSIKRFFRISPFPRREEKRKQFSISFAATVVSCKRQTLPLPACLPSHVCERFYDVCRPHGPLLLFITTVTCFSDTSTRLGLMKLVGEFRTLL